MYCFVDFFLASTRDLAKTRVLHSGSEVQS